MEARPRILQNYLTANNEEPFQDWMESLDRVGGGIQELRFEFGPGYRVYFGSDGDTVILLGGGDKSTQARDIEQAKTRWSDYNA